MEIIGSELTYLNIPPLMFVGTPQTNKYVINECKCIV
jgi:hypothetical protein